MDRVLRRWRAAAPAPGQARRVAAVVNAEGEATRKILTDIRWELREQRKYLEAFRHVVARDVFAELRAFTEAQQLGLAATLERVAADRISFARFGDAELKLMLRPDTETGGQPWSAGLAGDLRELLTMHGHDRERLLLGFPHPYRNLQWTGVWLDLWPELRPLLDPDLVFGTTHVTRPLMFQRLGEQGTRLWRDIWADRDVCVVTGEKSRFVWEAGLFDGVRSHHTVLSTSTDAYADLPRLMKELADQDPDRLYLVALGPAAPLVTAGLARTGRWAIDVGALPQNWAKAQKR
ncbi:GT-D fold domain-containing glycosyltransferase [Krasilnikovia sp. MM14-A1259]|uniref:GT-D fold domain-containing glycosyltransferase n=1 Tax=Krasilnikovia sp. MM14-A1259 TaxID=3373539 RepID=UPI003820EBA1